MLFNNGRGHTPPIARTQIIPGATLAPTHHTIIFTTGELIVGFAAIPIVIGNLFPVFPAPVALFDFVGEANPVQIISKGLQQPILFRLIGNGRQIGVIAHPLDRRLTFKPVAAVDGGIGVTIGRVGDPG